MVIPLIHLHVYIVYILPFVFAWIVGYSLIQFVMSTMICLSRGSSVDVH